MEGFGSLLRLAPVALEALLGVAATAHSGFGLFSGVSFGWGHADLVCIVMRSIPDIRETMSHRVSMSHRMDENLAIMQSHKPCIMNNFHEVASGNPLSCSLIFKFGKARIHIRASLLRAPCGSTLNRMKNARKGKGREWHFSYPWGLACSRIENQSRPHLTQMGARGWGGGVRHKKENPLKINAPDSSSPQRSRQDL